MKKLLLVALSLGFSVAAQADIMKDFDSLGGNDVLLKKAQALKPETRIEIVQDRIVKRRFRHEFSPEFGAVLGGDAYNKTYNTGLNYNFHFNHRWTAGLKYLYSSNKLTKEAENLINYRAEDKQIIPEIDYPKNTYLAVVNYAPVYGKFNFMDRGIVHFDIYGLGGAGQVELRSGTTSTWTAGGGMAFWWSQHLTSRFEVRYQNYTVKRFNGSPEMNLTMASFQIGYML
jgi:outer membrane immunogenic protein